MLLEKDVSITTNFSFQDDSFNVVVKKVNENVNINIINIESMSPEFKQFIDSKLVSIYKGTREIDLSLVKQKLFNFLDTKSDKTKMGSIAEFFIHLYLGNIEFNQECLMSNLEEGSIKKGFDGYYSKGEDEWIMESKSGTINTANISHKSKLTEAYSGLKSLLSGGSPNNPWENAYNHASHRDVNTQDNIVKNIRKYSDKFDLGRFYEIKNFNIIPSSTIFYNGDLSVDIDEVIKDIELLTNKLEFQKLEIICVSKKSLDLFIDYLKDPD